MIGNVIRSIRKSKSMTLDAVAQEVGMTSGGLSQIERGIIDPSLVALKKIAKVLDVSLHVLFSEENNNFISRSKDRKKAIFPDLNIMYEFMTPSPSFDGFKPKMEVNKVILSKKSWGSNKLEFHSADECFVVIKGEFEVHLPEDEVVTLYEDDSIYINEGTAHRLFNPLDSDSVALSILSDIVY